MPFFSALLLQSQASVPGWNIANTIYANKFFNTGDYPQCIFFKVDGTQMYMAGVPIGQVYIYQYTLSTPWDVSTASYTSSSPYLSALGGSANPIALNFKPDGTVFYISNSSDTYIYEYSLSSAWDITTATYTNKRFQTSGQTYGPQGLSFKTDGSKMYIGGGSVTYQYTVGTPWDISTASYASKSFNSGTQDNNQRDSFFRPDGLVFYILGGQNSKVSQYGTSQLPPMPASRYR
jgi:hypothetical protein